MIENRLIVALDVEDSVEALELVEKLKDEVAIFKVGLELFLADSSVVKKIQALGKEVFLDLKLHDIPNTVYRASKQIALKKVKMFTVHTLGGPQMLEAAVQGVADARVKEKPKVLGVTILTSIDKDAASSIGLPGELGQRVLDLAKLVQKSGLDGAIASPLETKILRENLKKDFLIVNPGIRLANNEKEDQKRIATPFAATKNGASYLVVGRPITREKDPSQAALGIIKDMQNIK